jgi:hypothetical protein
MALKLVSAAYANGHEIPAEFTRDGRNVSPPLAWSGVPATARSLVLVMDDADVPTSDAPERTEVHWVVYNLPAASGGLPADAGTARLPNGARLALNSFGECGYRGPEARPGRHRYFAKLYALDVVLPELGPGTDASRIRQLMRGHVVAQAQLLGTYAGAGRDAPVTARRSV